MTKTLIKFNLDKERLEIEIRAIVVMRII